ncbi:hypothetical protein GCM10023191_063370 [Actinoallomurus oryzae]|uniref:Uncharacterized protein n=1 Tax=Actinoallomurus oryzae TaxID=502180 RepID=A0ABP8QMB7_9ACTN
MSGNSGRGAELPFNAEEYARLRAVLRSAQQRSGDAQDDAVQEDDQGDQEDAQA